MRKLLVMEWITLDGVFDAENMNEWWMPYETTERQNHIKDVMFGCDAYLLGRITYNMLAPFWSAEKDDSKGPASWLNSVRKYVVSSTLKKADWNNSTIISEDAIKAITNLKKQQGKDILIAGSAILVHSLLETNLIDEFHFLIQPVIVESGKRFFKEGVPKIQLNLSESRTLAKGVLALTYQAD